MQKYKYINKYVFVYVLYWLSSWDFPEIFDNLSFYINITHLVHLHSQKLSKQFEHTYYPSNYVCLKLQNEN